MQIRYFALILGIIYTLVGVIGFVPGFLSPPDPGSPQVTVDSNYGLLLGLFPVNILHTLVHLVVGLGGIAAYFNYGGARTYAQVVGIVFAVLALMGLVPGLNTTFGLIPLFGNDVWLHALTALAGIYFGFVAREERLPV